MLMKSSNKLLLFALLYFFDLSGALSQTIESQSEGDLKERIQGDIGVAVYYQNSLTHTGESSTQILPYAYFDYDRFFARIDTFGFKTIPIGMGYLEIVGRYNQEGFTPKSSPYTLLNPRNLPVPLGLGTFQLTPYGAFFIYGFNDFNASKGGKMAEFTYAAAESVLMTCTVAVAATKAAGAWLVTYCTGVWACVLLWRLVQVEDRWQAVTGIMMWCCIGMGPR